MYGIRSNVSTRYTLSYLQDTHFCIYKIRFIVCTEYIKGRLEQTTPIIFEYFCKWVKIQIKLTNTHSNYMGFMKVLGL